MVISQTALDRAPDQMEFVEFALIRGEEVKNRIEFETGLAFSHSAGAQVKPLPSLSHRYVCCF